MLQIFDETGINPIPAGIEVSIYPAGQPQNDTTLIASAWTAVGGLADINVSQSVNYVADFFGGQAPDVQQAFSGGPAAATTSVTVVGYRSPSLSTLGYTQEQINLWPSQWFSDAARAPGGNAYPFAFGFGALFESLDAQGQYEAEKTRLVSSVGADIDSWNHDFLGTWLPRFQGESDPSFIGRTEAALQEPSCTLQGIQDVVNAFYLAILDELAAAYAGNLTYDDQGGYGSQGGYDTAQGFVPAQALPTVLVWDRQSRPDLANQFNINPHNNDGSFVIQIGFSPPNVNAWYLDFSHLDIETFLVDNNTYTVSTTAPDPRLAALVNLKKSEGTKPIYITSLTNA